MCGRSFGVTALILATFHCCLVSTLTNKPQFTLKAEKWKAFHKSFSIETFDIEDGSVAECLAHCLKDCRCQSFQICQNTKCQLCSSHKEENSLLLHEEDSCVYATYEMRNMTEHWQKLEGQCSDMRCSMNDNCCKQPGLCPSNKICKPVNSLRQPWKRFTCECKDGYRGDDCDQPIRSCRGYAFLHKSGKYKILDAHGSVYEVYCHFDKNGGAWTLVQSFSHANGSALTEFPQFREPLFENHPVGDSNFAWSGFRLSKSRMRSVKNDGKLLRFTCDHNDETKNVEDSDYLQIRLQDVTEDVLEIHGYSSIIPIQRGIVGGMALNACKLNLYQYYTMNLLASGYLYTCGIIPKSTSASCDVQSYYSVFGNYGVDNICFDDRHQCVAGGTSTTQLWFGY